MRKSVLACRRPNTKAAAASDPDVELMLRVQRDEPGAFGALSERFGGPIFAQLYRILHNREEAEDLRQEVFLRLYRSRHRYQPRAKFSTWVFHITKNVARNALRRRRRRHAWLHRFGPAAGSATRRGWRGCGKRQSSRAFESPSARGWSAGSWPRSSAAPSRGSPAGSARHWRCTSSRTAPTPRSPTRSR